MAKKKTEQPDASNEDKALEKKVDAMMDPRNSASPAPPVAPAAEAPAPEIDIFQDAKTAPEVSPELLKEIGIKRPSTPKTAAPKKLAGEKRIEPLPAQTPEKPTE